MRQSPETQRGWAYASEKKISTAALAWIAGFLEGEGSFIASGASFSVCASQVQREPLERLQVALGGSLHCYTNNHHSLYWRWSLHGSHAIGVAFTLYVFMSPRRKEQIKKMVTLWKRRPGKNNKLTTHCPRGHALTPDNTYLMSGRHRGCRECYRTFYGKQEVNSSALQPLDLGDTPRE